MYSIRDFINVLTIEYRINVGSRSLLYNIIYPDWCYKYLLFLRIYEFCRERRGIYKIISPFIKWKLHRLSFKTKIEIPTYTVGHGLKINHTVGNIVINSRARIGENCYLSNGVIIGQDNIHNLIMYQ